MRRREFLGLVGGAAAAWPLSSPAQPTSIPVVGFLNLTSLAVVASRLHEFRLGLMDAGYVEGENVAIDYRWAEGQVNRLPALATELVRRQVSVIAATNNSSALAAKAATKTIPIIFTVSGDPVSLGLVASLSRPGGNATGINFFSGELTAKRLELLRELMPASERVAVLVNRANPATFESTLRDLAPATRAIGLRLLVLSASTKPEIDAAFASLVRERIDALFVGSDAFLSSRRVQIVALATLHKIPTAYSSRDYVAAGGLISYGTNIANAYRQAGTYTGHILKGSNPADLPVVQPTKFELVINLKAAKALGLTVPPKLLVIADEVIE